MKRCSSKVEIQVLPESLHARPRQVGTSYDNHLHLNTSSNLTSCNDHLGQALRNQDLAHRDSLLRNNQRTRMSVQPGEDDLSHQHQLPSRTLICSTHRPPRKSRSQRHQLLPRNGRRRSQYALRQHLGLYRHSHHKLFSPPTVIARRLPRHGSGGISLLLTKATLLP
jgi:hypothetical protein